MKICKECGLLKSLTEYSRNSEKKDGYKSKCKVCLSLYKKKLREENKEHYRALNRASYKRCSIRKPHAQALRVKRWRTLNPVKHRNIFIKYQKELTRNLDPIYLKALIRNKWRANDISILNREIPLILLAAKKLEMSFYRN